MTETSQHDFPFFFFLRLPHHHHSASFIGAFGLIIRPYISWLSGLDGGME
jgi:hypothetical protein